MIQTTGLYHIGIPADDLERATRFYTDVLGMKLQGRGGEGGALLARLTCGDATVVLFQRPKPLNRKSVEDNGITHQAFKIPPETFDEVLAFLKREGYYDHGPVQRSEGRAVYFYDSEGNLQQILG